MKRALLVIVMAMLGSFAATAQEVDSVMIDSTEISIDDLVVKLNVLQHNYDYLYCNYELTKLILGLKDFSTSVSVESNSLLINYYNTKFDKDTYTSYVGLYNAMSEQFNSLKENADATKLAVMCRVLESNLTEQELKVISSSLELIESSISTGDRSLNYFKVVLDAYRNLR